MLGGSPPARPATTCAWVAQEKAKKGAPIQPLPVIKTFETFNYKDQDMRDPFSPSTEEQDQTANSRSASGPEPRHANRWRSFRWTA